MYLSVRADLFYAIAATATMLTRLERLVRL